MCQHFPSSPFSPDRPAFPMGEVIEGGGLAHQSNASLIVAPVWARVGERIIEKRRGGKGKGEGGRGMQRSVVSQRHRLMIARTHKESQVFSFFPT